VDGREIFFRTGQNVVMASSVTRTGDEVRAGTPVRIGLSDASIVGPFATDGKRFLVTQVDLSAASVPIEIVRNWSALVTKGR
jgi:hypothetical protein